MDRSVICLTASLALLLSACHKNRPSASVPAPASPVPATMPQPAGVDDSDLERQKREAAESALRSTTQTFLIPILFSFDDYDLDSDARELLDQKLEVMKSNPGLQIRATGHADERGSDEYNLALGQRRSSAAKRYLTQNGIDPARIEIATLGEERPACTDHVEACWLRNRRVEFQILAGTVTTPLR